MLIKVLKNSSAELLKKCRRKMTGQISKKYILIYSVFMLLLAGSFLLYQKYPNPGSRPPRVQQKNVVVLSETVLPTPHDKQKGPFACPSVQSFCQSGKDVFTGSTYTGFGGKLPSGSPIYAAFDGYFEATSAAIATSVSDGKSQDITLGILTDKENLLRAHYYFTGPIPKNKNLNVKAGEIIGYNGQTAMPLYQNSSLVFVLTRNDQIMEKRLGGERVRLTNQDFKQ